MQNNERQTGEEQQKQGTTPATPDLSNMEEPNMEMKLADLGKKIDIWAAQAEATKVEKTAELQVKHQAVVEQLKKLKECSEDARGEMKEAFLRAWKELKDAWEEIRSGSKKAADKFNK